MTAAKKAYFYMNAIRFTYRYFLYVKIFPLRHGIDFGFFISKFERFPSTCGNRLFF